MNWAKNPEVAFGSEIADRMAADYEEVTPLPLLPLDGCGLHILGQDIPIARGRCDWYVRIWKRRGIWVTAILPNDRSAALAASGLSSCP